MSKVIVHSPFAGPSSSEQARPRVSAGAFLDQRDRPLRDLRISVTDRCNFRCSYCMPREVFGSDHPFLPQTSLLSFEEIARFARIAVNAGVRKLRLTGGEPLLRKHLERLVEMLACMHTPDGKPVEVTLTTNGTLLARKARDLKNAGLARVTVSLDALDEALFARMSDSDVRVADVLAGIDAAAQAGIHPVKVNMVVRKGTNDHQIVPMAEHFRHSGHILRFIEYMDVGNTNGWKLDEVVVGRDVVSMIDRHYPLQAVQSGYRGEVAERWQYRDGAGEIGVITSVSQPFCGDCTRARLSPEGKLFLCLFASAGVDIRHLLRSDVPDDVIAHRLGGVWAARDDHYSELRGRATLLPRKVEMSYIGG